MVDIDGRGGRTGGVRYILDVRCAMSKCIGNLQTREMQKK
jgi:hypothetical protein